jgi:hypothetical protein
MLSFVRVNEIEHNDTQHSNINVTIGMMTVSIILQHYGQFMLLTFQYNDTQNNNKTIKT